MLRWPMHEPVRIVKGAIGGDAGGGGTGGGEGGSEGGSDEADSRGLNELPDGIERALEIPASGLFVPAAWKPRLRGVYLADVASAAECEWVVGEAERSVASAGGGGWSADGHHDRYQTRDLVVADNEALTGWLNAKLREVIWPALAAQFGLHPSELWLQDAFIVRYEPDGQRGLAPHLDDSELSFNIALSDPHTFGGGGTGFGAVGQTLRPQQGQMVSHFGRIFHAGEPVTSGTRHILAGFVCARSLAKEWRELRPQSGQTETFEAAAPDEAEQQRASRFDEEHRFGRHGACIEP